MFQTKLVEKIKIRILCSTTFSENRVFYKVVLKNLVELEKPQMTIRQRAAGWINIATRKHAPAPPPHTHARTGTHPRARTHTHKYIIFFAFPRKHWFRERACATL
jgi:hypothetical protein